MGIKHVTNAIRQTINTIVFYAACMFMALAIAASMFMSFIVGMVLTMYGFTKSTLSTAGNKINGFFTSMKAPAEQMQEETLANAATA